MDRRQYIKHQRSGMRRRNATHIPFNTQQEEMSVIYTHTHSILFVSFPKRKPIVLWKKKKILKSKRSRNKDQGSDERQLHFSGKRSHAIPDSDGSPTTATNSLSKYHRDDSQCKMALSRHTNAINTARMAKQCRETIRHLFSAVYKGPCQ